ncbi:SGNH/GDSL hydrolase family protein [Pseudaestuariivita atlantica]|nr:SGNH/GDSL hydrolase family protein [Pseudaestuariivita atlantica]
MTRLLTCLFLFLTPALAPAQTVIVAGDSVMAWNRAAGGSVADRLQEFGVKDVTDVSRSGARISAPALAQVAARDIRRQVRRARDAIVVLDGGANDLAAECSCRACAEVLDGLISADGRRGEIPAMVASMLRRGNRVVWAYYYDSPHGGGPFSPCADEIDIMEARIAKLARALPQMSTVDMAAVIDPANPAHYDPDRVHPSQLGSARIAALIRQALPD